jgi:hypothetical protein
MITDGLAKYLVGIIRVNQNDDEAISLIDAKLKELVNGELNECVKIADIQTNEWGNVAISVNRITKEIKTGIEKRKIR